MNIRKFDHWLLLLPFLLVQFLGLSYAGEKVTFYVSDRLTESAMLLDESGNVVGRERLATYGAIELSSPAEDRFSISYHGKERDSESGLINFGARMYDPDVGRFLSTDPRGFNESNLLSFNRYAFANNNPYRYTDPDGRVVETPLDFISLGVGLYSLGGNLSSGNWGAAALDFLSVGLDGVAAALPGIPGGASLIVKGQREAAEVASSLPNIVVTKGADDIFKAGRTPKASELQKYAEGQGWKPTQTDGGPLKYVDENGIPRVTIKQGSSRAPGSGGPHVELKDASGQRVDPSGNPVTRKSPGNHTPIDYDL